VKYYIIRKEDWDKKLEQLILSHAIFATVRNESGLDYELLKPADIPEISYNNPKPATPLKTFFLPVKENVTSVRNPEKPRIIIGAPNCDIEALHLLDEIYLDKDYPDIWYSNRRKNTILISSDCFSTRENCHCISYGVSPYTTTTADLSVLLINGSVIFRSINKRGEEFIRDLSVADDLSDNEIIASAENKNKDTATILESLNTCLPDYIKTGNLISISEKSIWKKYSSACVSCGGCTTICPTCTCFLLIDMPQFGKVKQMDACQYPGFERVAGGEDALHELPDRFRNRYMCKYLWKPIKYKSLACTGCGRCIDACIGKINKNELFKEIAG
jgi:sulfhydrogenase subunit beta (sulfur reductase)